MTPLKQAIVNIISSWEFQKESCEIFFPTTAEYELAYSKLTGLREALDHLRFAGLITYDGEKWEVFEGEDNLY